MAQEEQKAENNEKVAAAQSNAKKLYLPPFLNPMLASPTEKAFTREGWIYEPKLDGIRALAYVTPESTEIFSRFLHKSNCYRRRSMQALVIRTMRSESLVQGCSPRSEIHRFAVP